jgi:hypothetical protein
MCKALKKTKRLNEKRKLNEKTNKMEKRYKKLNYEKEKTYVWKEWVTKKDKYYYVQLTDKRARKTGQMNSK